MFSDEGQILENQEDPDLAYNQLIRPWKSRLGLIYIKNRSHFFDIQLIAFTVISIISKRLALNWIAKNSKRFGCNEDIILISQRNIDLYPHPPQVQMKLLIEDKVFKNLPIFLCSFYQLLGDRN